MSITVVLNKQKEVYLRRELLHIEKRKELLKKLKYVIKNNEYKILKALNDDLHKSEFEGYLTEVAMVYEEINLHIKKLKSWSKREKLNGGIATFPSKSYIYKEPYGSVLIIGPFNYPFQLVFSPLIGALSAGNTAVIKPSEYSSNTAKVIEEIINNNFDEKYIKVVGGNEGKEIVKKLLNENFDYIFFTGSIRVGKIIMEKAARNLTPVTLELGGKSPCIVDKDANLHMAAKRIIWGKLVNAGQTCVAPDYLFVHKDIKIKFLNLLKDEIKKQYGENINNSKDYPRIISKGEFKRIVSYIEDGEIYYGGKSDEKDLFIEPTILINIKENNKVMNEEIFGPVLPVLDFENINEVIEYVNKREKPLALYYFSENKKSIDNIINKTSAGGVTINDTVIHVGTTGIPFGGVGNSGMGSYHGKASFDTFSHRKPVVKRSTLVELPIRFAPYKNKLNLIRKVIK